MSHLNGLGTFALVSICLVAGWGIAQFTGGQSGKPAPGESMDGPCPNGAAPLYWKAPMDPRFVRDEPGKSPMGMDLIPECPNDAAVAGQEGVQIDSATVQNLGVRTVIVKPRDLYRSVRAVGRITNDERLVSHVHTKVQGYVERLYVDYVGQQVKQGEPLLEIYSPELVATQEELLLAARYRDSTRESSFEDVRRGGESLFEAAQRRLELWDIPERDIGRLLESGTVERTLTHYAPSSGVVIELGVRSGMEVKPNDNLYTIADLSRVWVHADIYEYELPWVALGQKGVVELNYRPGQKLEGRVTYISPFLDPVTRTATIRLELANPGGELKPEMFGNTVIEGAPRLGVLAIPQEAIIRSGRRAIAVMALGEGRFDPRDIELGLDSGDGWVEVTAGLDSGDRRRLSGQFLIDSESNLQEAVEKMRASGAAAEKGAASKDAAHDPSAHEHMGHGE